MKSGDIRKSLSSVAIAAALATGLHAHAAERQAVRVANVPEQVATGQAIRIAPLAQDQNLKLGLVLPLRNEAELDALLKALQDPRSPNYHQYLTNEQFTERFGATASDYAEVVRWAQANGLQVTGTTSNRHVVDVSGPVAAINRAFNVQLGRFQDPAGNRTFFAPDREPTTDLRVPLLSIAGLTDATPKVTHLHRGTLAQHMEAISRVKGSGPGGEYLPSDMRAAYYGNGPLTGTNQTVGIFSYDGYKTSDVTLFYSRTGMTSAVPIHNVLVSGFSGKCAGGANCDDGEQVLDIVNVIGMAPGLRQVLFYEGDLATDILNRMVTDNKAKVISCSWGGGDFNNASDDAIYKQMAAQGQTFLNATGDDGAYNGSTWIAPSLDANILDVGGTDLVVSAPGGSWVSETGWTGSSGGFWNNAHVLIPTWQKLAGVVNTTNKASSTQRNDPDVSAEADYDNPTVSNGQFQTGYGGTSFAAPRWAGLIALANQQSQAGHHGYVGFVNAKIYNMGVGATYHSLFHDVTVGNNKPDIGAGLGFNAVANFDLVTGWGTPVGAAFIDALVTP